jgi:hypothetical protein
MISIVYAIVLFTRTSWHNSASTQVYGSANAGSNKIFNAVANLVSNKLEIFFDTNKTMHYK